MLRNQPHMTATEPSPVFLQTVKGQRVFELAKGSMGPLAPSKGSIKGWARDGGQGRWAMDGAKGSASGKKQAKQERALEEAA